MNLNTSLTQIPAQIRANCGRGIKIAVLDKGIALNHPAFSRSVIHCYNPADGSSLAQDDFGHGTAVSGMIAACCTEYTGLAPACELFVAKVFGNDGFSASSVLINKALEWCIRQQVDIINISFSLPVVKFNAILPILNHVLSRGIIVVACAGDDNILLQNPFYMPASYPGVVSAGAITHSTYRSFHPVLDFIIPGFMETVVSHNAATGFSHDKGSSFSTAIISAIVALIMADARPVKLNKARIVEIINGYAVPYGQGMSLMPHLLIKPRIS